MKLVPADYMGSTAMDRRFSGPMLPWITSEIKKRSTKERVNLLVASGYISAYTKNEEEPLFRHLLSGTSKPQPVSANSQDSKGGSFVYFIKGEDGRFHYHLFKVKDNETCQGFLRSIDFENVEQRFLK